MAKERRNIEDIANVLIKALKGFDKKVDQLETIKLEPPELDYRPLWSIQKRAQEDMETHLKELVDFKREQILFEESQRKECEVFLDDLKEVYKIQHARIPNWLTGLILILFLLMGGLFWKMQDDYKRLGVLEKENTQLKEYYFEDQKLHEK